MGFDKDFTWGAAAASYQVEGAAFEDGKGASVWDMMCWTPDRIQNGDTGEVACDHYHRYKEDVALMKEIGLRAYRLSLSWPRILPEGVGTVNEAGIGFYDRLIDELLGAGIEPWVTLFHWDFPYALFLKGGWLNRESVRWFRDYAQVVVERLSDRVTKWMTFNEPQCFVGIGHHEGRHAPGLRLGMREVLLAGHHVMLAHGEATQVIRAQAKTPPQIGYAPVAAAMFPVTEKPEDVEAARTAMFSITSPGYWNNTWWMDPVYRGEYPEDGLRVFGKDAPVVQPGDLETIHQPLDYFGFNCYNGQEYRQGADGKPERVSRPTGFPLTAFNWPVTPDCLYWAPKFFYERYNLPQVITENGLSCRDWVSLDGKVHDPQRIDFVARHLRTYRRAAEEGIPLMGYFLWSVMDNFEWAEGYMHRFGLIHVDYTTLKRTLKDSAHWYRGVIESNGEVL